MSVFRQAATILTLGSQAYAFSLKTTYDSTNFLDKFNFRDAAYYNPTYPGDPTDGSVNYLSKADALASGIVNTNNNQVYLGVDFTNKAKLLGSSTTKHGRDSVRLESVDTWSTGIMIADIAHMPGTACGVWPAFWSYNFDENPVGEIDIIENINMQTQNIVSLHTCGQCTFTNIGGTDARANCNNGGTISQACEDGTNFDGCGNTMTKGSYGSTFNAAGGGVYATWLEQDALKLYWWKRSSIPADITSGNPDPTRWGTPASQFLSSSSCNVGTYFKDQTIIINTDFCGDSIDQGTWDSTCAASTGAKTCDQYVTNNPQAFKDSYWLFNSIKIYN